MCKQVVQGIYIAAYGRWRIMNILLIIKWLINGVMWCYETELSLGADGLGEEAHPKS